MFIYFNFHSDLVQGSEIFKDLGFDSSDGETHGFQEFENSFIVSDELRNKVKRLGNNKMERDKTHDEQIERWARFVRDNPEKWKARFKEFIDAQIIMARRFYARLGESEEGRRKIKILRGLE